MFQEFLNLFKKMMVGTILPLFEMKIEISSVDLLLEFKAVISVIRNMKPSFRIDRENLLVCGFAQSAKTTRQQKNISIIRTAAVIFIYLTKLVS